MYLRSVCSGLHAWLTIIHNDSVSQVSGHNEVVLHHEGSLLGMHDKALDHLGGGNALLTIQVG